MARTDWQGRTRWGLLLLGIWLLVPVSFAVVVSLQAPDGPGWRRLLALQLLFWLPWLPLAPAILAARRRWPLLHAQGWFHLPLHALSALAVGLALTTVMAAQEAWAGPGAWPGWGAIWARVLAVGWGTALFLGLFYFAVLVPAEVIAAWRRHRETEALLLEARLEALQGQVHPHFLFNSLHAISALMEDDIPGARRMLANLAHLLRRSLRHRSGQPVSLEEELDLARHYLAIEKARLGERLTVAWSIEPGLEEARVPPLILQPLVENAVRHGIAPHSRAGKLEIRARRKGGRLELAVADDGLGVGLEEEPRAGPAGEVSEGGLGLDNIRTRLETLFPGGAGLLVEPRAPRGTVARIFLPLDLGERQLRADRSRASTPQETPTEDLPSLEPGPEVGR